MIIGSHKRMIVYKKTGHKCSMCGTSKNLTCVCFIPEWTRIVSTDVENIIPLCDDCRIQRGYNFIEIGSLKYLPKLYIEQLLRYYKTIDKYLYKYVRLYAEYRTNNMVDVRNTLCIMQSYDILYNTMSDDLQWEKF